VLPIIKSEMNILRSGYAVSIKNQIIWGMCYMHYIACTAMMLTWGALKVKFDLPIVKWTVVQCKCNVFIRKILC
jgi:hypothetical protein